MTSWLDSWTNTRYLNQQELAKRWALRGTPEADERPAVLPIEDSKYILTHGKKAYRQWVSFGRPEKMPSLVCPVMEMVQVFFTLQRYPHMKRWPGYRERFNQQLEAKP